MIKNHSFYIPDIEYLTDIEGLLKYLTFKVSQAHICLHCNGKGKSFRSIEAVRKHMIDKGHTMIGFEDGGEEEIAPYYSFEKETWNDPMIHEKKSSISPKDGSNTSHPQEGNSDDDDAYFEDISDTASGEYMDDEQYQQAAIISPDESELILPSGKRIGHRDYRRYYKQYIRPKPELEASSDMDDENNHHLGYDKPMYSEGEHSNNMNQTDESHSSTVMMKSQERQLHLKNLNMSSYIPSSSIKEKSQIIDQKKWLKILHKKLLALGIKHNNQRHFRKQIL